MDSGRKTELARPVSLTIRVGLGSVFIESVVHEESLWVK